MKLRFKRLNIKLKKRVKDKWRKPRGIDSKQRQKLKAYGIHPDIGYRTPVGERNLRNGLIEVLVSNEKQLSQLNPGQHCVRFSSTLGRKKKTQMEKNAAEKKLRVVN